MLPHLQVTDVSEDKTNGSQVRETGNKDVTDSRMESEDELIVLDEISQETDHSAEENGVTEVTEEPAAPTPDNQGTEGDEESVVEKVTSVPHRSKFAEGIIPFEDTPEFTEVAEATGVYLRIRELLKESPRNQAKVKK